MRDEYDFSTDKREAIVKTVKTRSGRTFVLPTSEEDAAITAAAMADADARPFSAAEMREARAILRRKHSTADKP
ncbi:hypothetical protein AGMMS49545_15720 [Betaproteobacteria bacterium]|nr:hypothetical protein AGMMS49545_15720 [Betaproteobacteria bacterium]GHU45232.1 hypothetical protein AGMMS50289_15900 [Betaproteobacteria bacterium]